MLLVVVSCMSALGRRVCRQSVCGPRADSSHPDQNKGTGADEETETSQCRLPSCH